MQTFAASYYKKANGILLLYDCTDETSKKHVSNWMKQINQYVDPDKVKINLICNKVDLQDDRVVSTEEG